MSNTASPPASTEPLSPLSPRRRRSLLQDAGLVFVVLILAGLLTAYGYHDATEGRPNTFLNRANLIDGIATPMSNYAIMAAGMTIVIVAGGIDISVASILTLAALVTAWTLQRISNDTSLFLLLPLALTISVGIGLLCGLINGLLVIGLRVHPFIVTLGTLSIFRGTCNVLPFGTKTQSIGGPLRELFVRKVFGMQLVPSAVTLLVLAATYVYLKHAVAGRETYAVGGNEQAARFSGINVGWAKLRVYIISGMLAGLTGLVSLGRFGTVSTNSAQGAELNVVAAAVVGGASLLGGRGTAVGALLGTLILAMIENAINILHLNQEYKSVIVGLSILIAVSLDRLSEVWRTWRATRAV